ncbi:hypothetical protein OXX79_007338 [Metschnikowia pulcherrima]
MSIIEEQSPGMANVVENDQALVENEVSQKDKKEVDSSFFDSKFFDLARDRKPVPENDSFLELAMLHVDEDTDSDEYRDEVSSIESFGVDTEDMTEKEFSTYFELQNVLRRLNKRYPVYEEEQEKQEELAETLLYCLHNIRNMPEPKEDDCLARVQDIRRSFDRADMLMSTEPKKALEEFSLREIVKVRLSLEKIMDEMKQKRSDHCEVSKSVFRACNKMGAPKAKSSIEKFAQPNTSSLPDASGESETNVVSDDALANDEAFEMVRNIVGDKELYGLIFKQFSRPHISNPRAIAKRIDPPEKEIRERYATSLVTQIAS